MLTVFSGLLLLFWSLTEFDRIMTRLWPHSVLLSFFSRLHWNLAFARWLLSVTGKKNCISSLMKLFFDILIATCQIYCICIGNSRGVDNIFNPGGGLAVVWRAYYAPMVWIGLTDLPNSGGALAPPAPPLATPLNRHI